MRLQGLGPGFLLVILLAVFAAPACGRVYTLASGSAQGVYLPLANDMAVVARKSGVEIRVIPSEGSRQNLAWLAEGRADLALAQSDIAWNAYSGRGGFPKPVTSLRVIAPLYTEAIHILIQRTLYIHRIEDLRGKRIAVGPAGSGTETNAAQMLGAAGLTLAEVNARHLSIEESMAALRSGEIDAAFVTSAVPSPLVTGVLADRSATLLEPDRDFLERLRKIFPFYLTKNIETSDYPHLDEQVTTAGVQALLVGRDDIPAATIGHLVRAFSVSPELTAKYRLPSAGDGASDSEIPLFEEARSYYRLQSWLHQRKLFIGTVLFLLIATIAVLRFQRGIWRLLRRDGDRFLHAGIYLFVVWVGGSLMLYRAEHRINDNYASPWKSLWSGLITIYSLSGKEPLSLEGRVAAIIMFILGLGGLLWLIERFASFYVETKLLPLIRGGFARVHKMKNHYVIAGWNEKGVGIIKQLHGEELEHRHIVILAPEQAKGLPRHHKLIQVVHGERAYEDCLKEVNVSAAHSVIILADSAEPAEDARTILTILAIRKICSEQGLEPVPVSAEIVDSRNVKLAQYAGGEQDGRLEVVSSNDVGRSLLTQAAVHPGLFTVYSQLLEFKKNNSEIHRAPMPSSFVDKSFEEILTQSATNRERKIYVMPIAIQREGKIHINPARDALGKLAASDFLFALCDSPKNLENLS
ncbi:MAG TPA: TAXI family TRAP transporter solute-binding subunit [Thermoanaerobaculia bacterium]|jgi:hypothetical protein